MKHTTIKRLCAVLMVSGSIYGANNSASLKDSSNTSTQTQLPTENSDFHRDYRKAIAKAHLSPLALKFLDATEKKSFKDLHETLNAGCHICYSAPSEEPHGVPYALWKAAGLLADKEITKEVNYSDFAKKCDKELQDAGAAFATAVLKKAALGTTINSNSDQNAKTI